MSIIIELIRIVEHNNGFKKGRCGGGGNLLVIPNISQVKWDKE